MEGTMKTKIVAYDYENQCWITDDDAATALRRRQLTEELELLTGPRGVEYAQFLGATHSVAVDRCHALLATLI